MRFTFYMNILCQASVNSKQYCFSPYFNWRNFWVGKIKSMLLFSCLILLVGSMCNCILPNALKSTTVPHDPNFQEYESEKKRLRSSFTCLSSISMPQKEVSMSSLFLHSHYKGCLPPWELKRSRNGSLKKWWEYFRFPASGSSVKEYLQTVVESCQMTFIIHTSPLRGKSVLR